VRETEIMQKKVPLLFKDEDAVGEDVNREVYAVFWDNFVTHYCEGKFMVKNIIMKHKGQAYIM
jgi:hypothetical protein